MEIEELIEVAKEARTHALTFRTSVGVAYETWDGKAFGGFNLETYGQKGEHAEEVGLMRLLAEGYMGTDIKRLVVVFGDAGSDELELFPACLTCWARLWEFTHPYLEIVVTDTDGCVQLITSLWELLRGVEEAGGSIYPTNHIRLVKPKLNFKARLPLAPELMDKYTDDTLFSEYCDAVLHVEVKQ